MVSFFIFVRFVARQPLCDGGWGKHVRDENKNLDSFYVSQLYSSYWANKVLHGYPWCGFLH